MLLVKGTIKVHEVQPNNKTPVCTTCIPGLKLCCIQGALAVSQDLPVVAQHDMYDLAKYTGSPVGHGAELQSPPLRHVHNVNRKLLWCLTGVPAGIGDSYQADTDAEQAGLRLLAHSLVGFAAQQDLRLDTFALGPASRALGRLLCYCPCVSSACIVAHLT